MTSTAPMPAMTAATPATLAVALLDAAPLPYRTDQVLTPDGISVGTRTTYADGTEVWLLPHPAQPDLTPTALGPGPATGGPVMFIRVDGHALTAEQVRGRNRTARVARTRSATVMLVTAGLPSGPIPSLRLRKINGTEAPGHHMLNGGHR
ncbi:hypothetical protein GCM10018781_55870 [Kitasatospora indigofera]|uniref:Uncharacterized protein n=1 Tax=Kitasatospora indigofera TaxID=67307 RepID=A0A919L005_9ACTN|nr:hypothetical protein [Kitasatospora indigofera]GHH78957.1 hypothetical protein GCM10018781_55870 [Kitasatospora indigofera]